MPSSCDRFLTWRFHPLRGGHVRASAQHPAPLCRVIGARAAVGQTRKLLSGRRISNQRVRIVHDASIRLRRLSRRWRKRRNASRGNIPLQSLERTGMPGLCAEAASDPSLEAEKGQYANYSTSFVRSERQQRQGLAERLDAHGRHRVNQTLSFPSRAMRRECPGDFGDPLSLVSRPGQFIAGAFGDCGRKRFDVAIGRIIENENFGHEMSPRVGRARKGGKSARSQANRDRLQ